MASDLSSLRAPSVFFVTRKWAPAVGGMETWSHRLSEELAEIGPVEVVALPGRRNGSPPSVLRLLGFPLTVVRRYLAARPAPRVLHIGDMALWPLGLLARLRASRMVISAHGTDVSYPRRGGVRGTLYGWYLRLGARVLGRAAVIANSRATAEAAAESGWRVAGIVPLGTDLSAPSEREAHDGAILFAGRLIEQKGCGWFVREVLPLLAPETRLRIAGTLCDKAEAFVVDHPRVEHLGALDRSDLAEAYARAMCVIVPNIVPASRAFEGFGLVACEAAACGGVVLAANTGGLVEAVRDGETGLLLPSGDAAAWAAAIEKVARWSASERARFTQGAAESARTHYSWPRVARETAAHYHG